MPSLRGFLLTCIFALTLWMGYQIPGRMTVQCCNSVIALSTDSPLRFVSKHAHDMPSESRSGGCNCEQCSSFYIYTMHQSPLPGSRRVERTEEHTHSNWSLLHRVPMLLLCICVSYIRISSPLLSLVATLALRAVSDSSRYWVPVEISSTFYAKYRFLHGRCAVCKHV